jgi:hypothetical protein
MKKFLSSLMATLVTGGAIWLLLDVNGRVFCFMAIAYLILALFSGGRFDKEENFVKWLLTGIYVSPVVLLMMRTAGGPLYNVLNFAALCISVVVAWAMVRYANKKSGSY